MQVVLLLTMVLFLTTFPLDVRAIWLMIFIRSFLLLKIKNKTIFRKLELFG